MCQPAINGGEQSEKSLQILIIFFFGQYCDILGGTLFGKLLFLHYLSDFQLVGIL
jgi:hypothetical protein